ncbi:uncharacterized protein MEPE_05803 [Melanopsichium pennsylvanicum]|uniref:Impact N-terminal domain-containing protein n=2 Tax=Melanopsichium pennsylvanicum TaxID=63383 RepID=A0AAJ4XRR2_9BASI|nr:conserved hypothetical protein [Melanopsichium pennsylvanicum 4]SNX87093.1 uncharacterized protein MEPE_05803 [Melanopsichium pennsylvanicum]
MLRRKKTQNHDDSLADLITDNVIDGALDDELARELEQERQKILAASGSHGPASPTHTLDDQHTDNEAYLDDDDLLDPDNLSEQDDDSEDEWQPPQPPSRPSRQSKRQRRASSSQDSDFNQETSQNEDELSAKKFKKAIVSKASKASAPNGQIKKAKTSDTNEAANGDDQDEEYNSYDEEAERVQAEVEAAAAWADVRRRKEAATSSASSSNATGPAKASPAVPPSLTSWLGKGPSASSSTAELASSLSMPTSSPAAQIVDRSSLFIGYVYPLQTPNAAYISALLSHLTRVVHPTVPVSLLPPQFSNAPASKRGSSHDMYAYRVFELKRGRTGLAGPDDFSLQEDKEDDGERWGGDRVLKVVKEEGASDVLVVVSRWYGGELLGPVRFDHIENAAREALKVHVQQEEVDEFRQRIQHLDRRIGKFKARLQANGEEQDVVVSKYDDLTLDKGKRLWVARQKALEALQKRLTNQSAQASQSDVQDGDRASTTDEVVVPNAADAVDAADAGEVQETTTVDLPVTTVSITQPVQGEISQNGLVKPDPVDITIPAAPAPIFVAGSPPEVDTSTSIIHAITIVKPEPVDPALISLNNPIRVKDEPDSSLSLFSFITEDQEEDNKSKVKFETDLGETDDLTGWDDLSFS